MVFMSWRDVMASGRQASALAARLAILSAKRDAPESDAPKTLVKKVDPKATPDLDPQAGAGNAAYSITAGESFQLWQAWCRRHDVDHGSQRRFGEMMDERFAKDRNNGYPRYLGVRSRINPGPALHVVASQGARRGAGKNQGARRQLIQSKFEHLLLAECETIGRS
jgi:hypothetical protein